MHTLADRDGQNRADYRDGRLRTTAGPTSSLSRSQPKSLKLPGIGKFLTFSTGKLFETIFL
jgi:hypothetical protein